MSIPDLTRWNRAGLDRFRYVDGNAATFLEEIRIGLVEAFHDPLALPEDNPWQALIADIPEDESDEEKLRRILEAYAGERGDWAMEISRAFSRATHILTETVDAYANEGYLRTATQWDTIRKLAAMIDYVPAPASSAETPLVLLAEDDIEDASVEAGFAVKNEPDDGSAPKIFETLEDVAVATALNALRILDYDHNPEKFATADGPFEPLPADDISLPLWPLVEEADVAAGQPAILIDLASGGLSPLAVRIDTVADDDTALAIIPHDATPGEGGGAGGAVVADRIIGDTRLDIAPAILVTPRLNGPNVVRVTGNHGLTAGETIGWLAGDTRHFARINAADANAIELVNPASLPAGSTRLYRARSISRIQFTAAGSNWLLPLASEMPRSGNFAFSFVQPDGNLAPSMIIDTTTTADFVFDSSVGAEVSAIEITVAAAKNASEILFFDAGRDPSPAQALSSLPSGFLTVDGNAAGLNGGMQVVLAGDDDALEAQRILYVLHGTERSYIRFASAPALTVITAIHADFSARLAPTGHDRDPTPIGTTILELDSRDIADWPKRLGPGRRVVLESESGIVPAVSTIIDQVDQDRGEIALQADVSELKGFTVGDLIVRGNVVMAGHGESKPGKIVGSGDASRGGQSFTLTLDELTHVSDPLFPSGIRAAVDVEIEGRTWQQLPSLRDAFAADAVYTARLDADANLILRFGDGFAGRKLPSGRNNVFVYHRRGAGLGGNLASFGLAKIVNAHAAVADVLQPVEASGGDEREPLESIRDNAAERLAALDRAVSLSDFAALAKAVQGVWHARARATPPAAGRRRGVIVTIVPAGGGVLGIVGDRVAASLAARSIPGVDITIEPYEPVALSVHITLNIDTEAFDPARVAEAARADVEAAFDLRRRAPGQPVYRSELYAIVETVAGVSNAIVELFPELEPGDIHSFERVARGDDDGIWAITPAYAQAIFAQDPGAIAISTAEAST